MKAARRKKEALMTEEGIDAGNAGSAAAEETAAANGAPAATLAVETAEHEQIARLAYSYWEARGCPDGSAEEDWLRAERELQAPVRAVATAGSAGT